jgi:hypothetical protein
VSSQLRGMGVVESAPIGFADRRACSGDDYRFSLGHFGYRFL